MDPARNQRSAFEEYRYDALGRRILVRSRQMDYCAINCQNVVRRTVWDGDQVLAEIQAPGDSGVSSTLMESDGGLSVHVDAGSVVLPDHLGSDAEVAPTDTMPQAQIYRGYQFGRVVYTHGPGIDAPLSLIRMDYSDSIRTPQLVVPHNDWRGEYDIGSYAGGTLTKPCVRITRSSNFKTVTSDGTISDYPKAPGPINTSWYHCVEVEWPAPHVWVTRDTRNRSLNGPLAWMGTLIDGMRDNSGQMYMRNRYYDPASGRFTQEDPIGLAGGLNAYGFVAGDPVNYEDPYGLCEPMPWCLVRQGISAAESTAGEIGNIAEEGLAVGLRGLGIAAATLFLASDSCPECEFEAQKRRLGVYHRMESPTQTPADAAKQEQSGEIWGRAPRGSDIPTVQAFKGPLPPGARGIEFFPFAQESPGSRAHPVLSRWRPGDLGVELRGDFAVIKVRIIKNTQRTP